MAYKQTLPAKAPKPYAQEFQTRHKEFRAAMIDGLQVVQDEARDAASLVSEDSALVGHREATESIAEEINGMLKGEAIKGWSAEDALRAVLQALDRLDPSDATFKAQQDARVAKLIQDCANVAWEQSEAHFRLACDHIQEMDDEDSLTNCSLSTLVGALGQEMERVTHKEICDVAEELKRSIPQRYYWPFIASLSVA